MTGGRPWVTGQERLGYSRARSIGSRTAHQIEGWAAAGRRTAEHSLSRAQWRMNVDTRKNRHEQQHAGNGATRHHCHNRRSATWVCSGILKGGTWGNGLTRIAWRIRRVTQIDIDRALPDLHLKVDAGAVQATPNIDDIAVQNRLGVDSPWRQSDPKGTGQSRWAMRWNPALNAFAITFADRMPEPEER